MQTYELEKAGASVAACLSAYGIPPPDREAMRFWLKPLMAFPLAAVVRALEEWSGENEKAPKPSQIAKLAARQPGVPAVKGHKQQCGFILGGKRCPLVAVVLNAGLCSGHWQMDGDPQGSAAYLGYLMGRPELRDGDWKKFVTRRKTHLVRDSHPAIEGPADA